MSILRMIIGLCLLVAPFVALVAFTVASLGLMGTVVFFGSAAVVAACILGGLALLDG